MALQTARQRLRNEKFAKRNEKQMGKPKMKKRAKNVALPKWVIGLLCFLLIGGGLLELIRLFL
ncbi:hypothetical protein BRETT_003476 [Brettanomyces bruxellensis]|uniref:Stress-associated endoplasmic reticulum protein n=1 Tax=Dekkera bruxellensis TaxID=5007 RepID=A0A871R124_DEKBR|nr:uncharacterized protein BRETT_003476 [Brettanomyces bruxellensis]QOU19329.1 hypothetical protein BRETT_003476 [Brettanomyces bruxellensis]